MRFMSFIQTPAGRILRVCVGGLLVWYGAQVTSLLGLLLMMVGLVPLVGGIANVCLLAEIAQVISDRDGSRGRSEKQEQRPREHHV